jgi:type IV secretory pathway VirB3-like protein
MDDETSRPTVPLGVKVIGFVILAVVAWFVFLWISAAVRTAFALLGYLVVAVIAYFFGKAVGRASAEP